MPGSIVQRKGNGAAASGSVSVTLDSDTTSGNSFAIFVICRNATGALSFTVSDNKSNTVSLGANPFATAGDFARCVGVWYIQNGTGGASHQFTATLSSGTADISIYVAEINGVISSSYDLSVFEANGFSDPMTLPATGTLAQAASFLVCCVASEATTHTPGGSWLESLEEAPAVGWSTRLSIQYQSVSSTSSVANNCDFNASTNNAAAVIAFKEALGTSEQEGHRFRNDDGSESTATWAANQDSNITAPSNANLRLRFVVNTTNDLVPKKFRVSYRKKNVDTEWKALEG